MSADDVNPKAMTLDGAALDDPVFAPWDGDDPMTRVCPDCDGFGFAGAAFKLCRPCGATGRNIYFLHGT